MGNLETYNLISKYETVQFFFRKHWTHFLKPIVIGFVVGLLAVFFFLIMVALINLFGFNFFYPFFAFLAIIVSIIFIHVFSLQLFNFFFNVIVVTDCRIIISRKTVFLRNDNDSIDLTKIQDIGVISRGLFRNYLNYGALVITLSTSAPPVVMPFVPNPHYYLEQMNRVKREHILRRQEHKMAVAKNNPESPVDYLKDIDKLEYVA